MKFNCIIYWLLTALCFSCQCKPETIAFTDMEAEFVPYQLDEIVRFKNLETDDITEFTVVKDSLNLYEESNNGGSFLKFCSGNSDDTFEERIFELESENCRLTYRISTEGQPVALNFFIDGCDISISGGTLNGELPLRGNGNFDINGTLYNPVYTLENAIREILITPQLGVFTFIDELTQDRYLLIE